MNFIFLEHVPLLHKSNSPYRVKLQYSRLNTEYTETVPETNKPIL